MRRSDLTLIRRWSDGTDGLEMGTVLEWDVDVSDLDAPRQRPPTASEEAALADLAGDDVRSDSSAGRTPDF